MAKRKLSDSKIIQLATMYATGPDNVNTAYLAVYFCVSRSTVSKSLHYAIENGLISSEIAKDVAMKAVRHNNEQRILLGYEKSNDVRILYDALLYKNSFHSSKAIDLNALQSEYMQLLNQFNSYDSVISSSDEFPYTKDELETRIFFLEKRLQNIENFVV